MRKKYGVILLLAGTAGLFPLLLAGQTKYEREYGLKPGQAPAPARVFIDQAFPGEKVKWYGEESLTGKSVEAKIIRKKTRYSVEFDTLGNLQDAEILIPWDAVPAGARTSIQKALDQNFSKYKIQKIQLQWAGPDNAILNGLQSNRVADPVITRYELVVKGKKERSQRQFEMLFNASGALLNTAEIIQRNTHHLDY